MTQTFFYPIDNHCLHYHKFGSGEKLLIAFHGFGDDAKTFEVLEPSLGKRYTIISVDLPFHGNTEWKSDEKFTPQHVQGFVSDLMKQHNVNQVSLAAYSIGGKVVLKLFEMNPERVESLWLFAPDGLKNNIWYNLAVYPKWGRKLFRYLLNKPNILIGVVRLLRTLRIFPGTFAKFLESQLQNKESREQVWNTWIGIAGFEVPPRCLKELLRRNAAPCYIFMGQYDPVIKPKIGKQFAKNLSNIHLVILPKGHALLKSYLNDYIERILTR